MNAGVIGTTPQLFILLIIGFTIYFFVVRKSKKPSGKNAQSGIYTWKIEVEEIQNKEIRQFLGHVTLLK